MDVGFVRDRVHNREWIVADASPFDQDKNDQWFYMLVFIAHKLSNPYIGTETVENTEIFIY
jgi:hypothetical protein